MSTQSGALTRTYYALESFCENMGENIVPYLPDLVEKLVVMIAHSPTVHGLFLGAVISYKKKVKFLKLMLLDSLQLI